MRARTTGALLALSLFTLTTAESCGESTGPKSYFLALSTAGSGTGTVSASPAGNDDNAYVAGTTVTVTATAAAGSEFIGWDELDVKGCSDPKNPCTLLMDDRKSEVAKFAPNSGAGRFDGKYTGTVNTLGGQPVQLTMLNGTVQGEVAPLYGSLRNFSGTVSATGGFSATVAPGPGSNCATSLTGTIATSVVDGITRATLSGTFQVTSTGGVGCGAGNPLPSGSWSATRDLVHVSKM